MQNWPPCQLHHDGTPSRTVSVTGDGNLCPRVVSNLSPLPQLLAANNLPSGSVCELIGSILYKKLYDMWSLAWLLSLSKASSFICVLGHVSTIYYQRITIIWICCVLFISLSMDEHFGCFFFFPYCCVLDNVAVNNMYVDTWFLFSWL